MLAVDVRVEQVAMSVVGIGGQVLGTAQLEPAPAHPHARRGDHARGRVRPAAHRGAGASPRRAPGSRCPASCAATTAGCTRRPTSAGATSRWAPGSARCCGCRCGSATTPSWARWPSTCAGSRAGPPTSSTCRRTSGSAAASSPRGGRCGAPRGYVGEIGHLPVRPGGRPCYCGSRGCWETEVGEAALRRALGLPEGGPRGVVVAELRALEAGLAAGVRTDPLVEFAEWLATGLVTVVNLLAPQLVVLGDLFTALPRCVVDDVRAMVHERSLVSRAVGRHADRDQPAGPRRQAGGRGRAGVRAGAGRGVDRRERHARALPGAVLSLPRPIRPAGRSAARRGPRSRRPARPGRRPRPTPPAGTRALSPRAESVTAVGSIGATRRVRSRRPNSTSTRLLAAEADRAGAVGAAAGVRGGRQPVARTSGRSRSRASRRMRGSLAARGRTHSDASTSIRVRKPPVAVSSRLTRGSPRSEAERAAGPAVDRSNLTRLAPA